MTIQRYDVVYRIDDEGEGYRKFKDVDGPYVTFADHERTVAGLCDALRNATEYFELVIAGKKLPMTFKGQLNSYRALLAEHAETKGDQ